MHVSHAKHSYARLQKSMTTLQTDAGDKNISETGNADNIL